MSRYAAPAAAVVLLGAIALMGCAPSVAPGDTATGGDASPTAQATATPTPTPTSAPAAQHGAPACEELIPASLVEQFSTQNWTYRADVFRVADLTLEDGVQCVWGDYSVASDHVLIFGWAAATTAQQDHARSVLLGSGWRVVEDESGSYVTEDPATAVATDENGYGMTYQFGDGWIAVADTKQGLLLIDPPA